MSISEGTVFPDTKTLLSPRGCEHKYKLGDWNYTTERVKPSIISKRQPARSVPASRLLARRGQSGLIHRGQRHPVFPGNLPAILIFRGNRHITPAPLADLDLHLPCLLYTSDAADE